ncbi:hypothetical protein ACQ3G7_12740 [Kosakonia oryzendophytica]|uniref:hypothetical protein n=1 Tax=Kosakonia oryzendophytica TaxID=1005665 RepID=UPI003D3510AE
MNVTRQRKTKYAPTLINSKASLIPEEQAKKERQTREYIRIMNKFVAEHGVLTDDDYFRVL